MAFKIQDHQNKTFYVDIQTEGSEDVLSYQMLALSYNRWNEIGLMVVADEAPKIKNPDNPRELIHDANGQRALNAEAEMQRNAMRVVESLEGGEGIDWGDAPPDNLADKAQMIMDIDSVTFLGLLTGLRNRAFGAEVSSEDAQARFQRLESEAVASGGSEADDN